MMTSACSGNGLTLKMRSMHQYALKVVCPVNMSDDVILTSPEQSIIRS